MAEKTKRQSKAKIFYLQSDASEKRHVTPETVGLRVEFTDGTSLTLVGDAPVEMLPDAYAHPDNSFVIEPTMKVCATWYGSARKLSVGYGGDKEVSDAIETCTAHLERLALGEWSEERERAGPVISILVQAIVAARVNAGLEADEAKIAEMLKSDKDKRDGALGNLAIKAEYERIRAERAAERAVKASEAATADDAEVGSLDDYS